jgi:hypothetical protein
MPIRTLEIERLNQIADRRDLLPKELRSFDLILLFEILYGADVYTQDSEQRGGSWGRFFNFRERRMAQVKLHLYHYLATEERYFRNSKNQTQTMHVYTITPKGVELLVRLKREAGIA